MFALPSLDDGDAESLVNSGLEASVSVEPPATTRPPRASGGTLAIWFADLGSSCKKLDRLARSAQETSAGRRALGQSALPDEKAEVQGGAGALDSQSSAESAERKSGAVQWSIAALRRRSDTGLEAERGSLPAHASRFRKPKFSAVLRAADRVTLCVRVQ